MNNIALIGNLASIETKKTADTTVAKMTVAIDRAYGDKADFIPVTTFGKTAELCERYLEKGRKIAVEGRIQFNKYEKDGETRTSAEVIANRVEFL